MARVIFMGTPRFAVPILEALLATQEVVAVVTQPDQRGGRGRKQLLAPPTKEVALAHGIPVLQPRRLHRPEIIEALRALRPDVIVVAAFGQILRENVLSLPPHGCVNVHASLLPRCRGAAPIAGAILAGERETGVTIMLMDAGVDTGPILAQRRVAIEPEDTTGTLTERLAVAGAELLVETLPRWLAGQLVPQPQEEHGATLCPTIEKDQGRIDWRLPAEQIARQIRAYDPWPGTTTTLGDKPLKLVRARALPGWRGRALPGTVLRLPEGIAVATGEGALLLEEIQPAGKRAMTCQAYLCGQRDFVGAVLGENASSEEAR